MTPVECAREPEVIEAVLSQRWPARTDHELRAHAAACAVCGDLAETVAAVFAERDALWTEVAPPPAELVWLRAQARARADASCLAARPVAIMQALGLASATAVMSLLIGLVAVWVWQRADWFESLPAFDAGSLEATGLAIRGTLLAIGLWLVLAPVAVYLVASDD